MNALDRHPLLATKNTTMGYMLADWMRTLPRKSTTADDLPNELLLYIFPLLSLESLITARRVNRRWRHLVLEAHTCPLRARLLRLYLSLIRSPAFHHSSSSRSRLNEQRVMPCLRDYDREDYLRLVTSGSDAPEEFKTWVREWPTHATWPGISADGATYHESPSAWSPGSWCLHIPQKPYLKCVTFSGGKSPFDPGVTLYATRILPIEFSGLSGIQRNFTELDGGDGEPSVEVTILCFGGGRALVLDGRRGGEALAGIVYIVRGSYTMRIDNILARSWAEYLEKDLKAAERSVLHGVLKGKQWYVSQVVICVASADSKSVTHGRPRYDHDAR